MTLKDAKGGLYTLNSSEHRVQERGGRGRKVFTPKGPLRVVSRLHLQLLPGQSMPITCPQCHAVRIFDQPGSRYINYICQGCSETE